MYPDIKKKWIKALRSGNYVQGCGNLRTSDNRFCCLGVLADIVSPSEWTQSSTTSCFRFQGSAEFLTFATCQSVGLSDDEQNSLAYKNDHGDTFDQIADYIEKTL